VPQAPRTTTRPRRSREDIRERLLESALVEFGAKGFDGASTRAIAQRVDAHQPQINYHFASKQALWNAAVDHLFGLLTEAMDGVVLAAPSSTRAVDALAPADLAAGFAEMVRRFVRFAAAHPELNQIMVHEATESSDRLTWMVANYVRPFYDTVRAVWARLREAGYAAPVEASMVHWVLVGAASLPYVTAPAARLLPGEEPPDPAWVETHAASLVTMLLPGWTPPTDG
jgi:AcrR family transcriptional regulator